MSEPGLNRVEWEERLQFIGDELARQGADAEIVLLGSVPGILAGQPARTTMDCDVWRPLSRFEAGSFRRAVEAAGLLCDPRGDDPEAPYIQIIQPGIVQAGDFAPLLTGQYGSLTVSQAPAANLIASKLVRASERDLYDVAWLLAHYQPEPEEIRRIVQTFPAHRREAALENLVYLDALGALDENPAIDTQ